MNLPSTFVTIPNGIFKYCSGLSGKFILPESTTSIGPAAFASCTALNSINIPSSVTAIYQAAFSKCTSLTSIWNYCQIPVNLSSAPYVFENVNQAACILYVPVGTKAAYQAANKWKDFANIVEMPSLSLSASTASLAATLSNNATVKLISNTTWTASSDQAWLTVSPTSGTGNQTLTFTADANTEWIAHAATVTVSSAGIASQTITVTQDGKSGETVTDIDGNVYHTVTIGTQTWTVENLKTTKYNDGTDIPKVTDNAAWTALTTGAYCLYNNDDANKSTYGALYNWYTVNTGKLAPVGWHVPTDAEWTNLTDFLINNGYGYEGSGSDIAKSMAATSGWTTHTNAGTIGNDQASNNSSGFTALPGGYRNDSGTYEYVGYFGYWWSSTESSTYFNALDREMYYYGSYVGRSDSYKGYGKDVRLVKGDNTTSSHWADASNLKAYTVKGAIIIEGEVGDKAIATLYNLQGLRVRVQSLQKGSLNTLSCPDLMNGIYVLTIQQDGETVTRKLIKK